MKYGYERLTDLSNSEASKLLKALYEALSQVESDHEIPQVKEKLGLNDSLFDDLMQLMSIKGWIETAE